MTEASHDSGADLDRVKILFFVEQDEDGYPPYQIESLWARETSEGTYELRNVPFFTRGVNFKDMVAAKREHGALYFSRVVHLGGHSTARIVIIDRLAADRQLMKLKSLGCSLERSMLPSLLAVDIPPEADDEAVVSALDDGERNGWWEWENAGSGVTVDLGPA